MPAALLGLALLLAACSQEGDLAGSADLSVPSSQEPFEFSLDTGASAPGSFTVENDEGRPVRYNTSVSVGWLAVTSNGSGRLSPGQGATIGFRATCPSTPGDYVGSVTVSAKGDTESVTVSLSCSGDEPPTEPPPAGEFEITLVFSSTITEPQKAVFESAADRWAEVITGDVADTPFAKAAGACGAGEPAFDDLVDDVVIYASVEPIDGPGSVLGSAGPCYVRSSSDLPLYGTMRFDEDDVGSLGGDFEAVILHEMGHVLGVGTLWDYTGLLSYRGRSCQNAGAPTFTGSGAVSEWLGLGGSGDVPVEDGGGSGTKCGHWDEETFDHELMTGYLGGSEAGNPLSRTTAASLGDLGYEVSLGAADDYALPVCSPACLLDRRGLVAVAEREVLLSPVGVVDEDGAVRGVPAR